MMSQFTVLINTDNAAFKAAYDAEDDVYADGVAERDEIVRILRDLADKVEINGHKRVHRIRDVNGSRVGFATGLDVAEVPA